MDVKTRMAFQPALDGGMFMGGVVIHDQMELFVLRGGVVDKAQEVNPLLMPMPLLS